MSEKVDQRSNGVWAYRHAYTETGGHQSVQLWIPERRWEDHELAKMLDSGTVRLERVVGVADKMAVLDPHEQCVGWTRTPN